MKCPIILVVCALSVLALAISPAQAFTAKNLDISVAGNTDATITFDYELSFFEQFAVLMRIADPSQELKKALESNFKKPVTVLQTDGSRAQFIVAGFASAGEKNGTRTLRTPGLSFANAQKVLDQYWFAPLISPDFSPSGTKVTFPDGYMEEYYEQIEIPSIVHALNA